MLNQTLQGFNLYPKEKRAEKIGPEQLKDPVPPGAYQWIPFDLNDKNVPMLLAGAGLEETVLSALLKKETRPRVLVNQDEMLVILRGLNLAQGEAPEDMVSLRMHVSGTRIISCQKRLLQSVEDLKTNIDQNIIPPTTGHLLTYLCERLTGRMSELMEDIEECSFEMEEKSLDGATSSLENDIHSQLRQVIQFKRYLVPQKEALLQLQNEKMSWLSSKQQLKIREVSDQLIRYLEMLDAAREMAIVSQESLYHLQNKEMNKRMYLVSVMTALFLPLGFFTGLLGVNLAGIPQAHDSRSFLMFVLLLVVIILLQLWYFRKKGWF